MAGHSKWANIKHKKAKQDAVRGRVFTRLIREITVAARMGGVDPESNARLRAAIQTAFAANMPKDTVQRAISRGAGDVDGALVEEIRYEGYASGGVAILVDCMTDNRNRTAGEVRHAFTRCGGNLGTPGSVSYLFDRRGLIHFAPSVLEAQATDFVLMHNAEDVQIESDGTITVLTAPDAFSDTLEAAKASGLPLEEAEITEVPSTQVEINDLETAEKVLKLTDMLETLEDTQKVHTNAVISDAIAAQL